MRRRTKICYFVVCNLKRALECYYGRISAKKKKFGVEFYYDGRRFWKISRDDIECY